MRRLKCGSELSLGKFIESASGSTRLTLEADGNLALSCERPEGWVVRWETATGGQGVDRCVMETSGCLNLYAGNRLVWSSATEASPGAVLSLEDDESALITHGDREIWSSNSSMVGVPIMSSRRPEIFVLQDGELRSVPDPPTLLAKYGGWASVSVLPDRFFESWPRGDALRSVADAAPPEIQMCLDRTSSGTSLPPRTTPQIPPQIASDGSIIGVNQQPLAGQTEKMWNVGATVRVKLMGGTPIVRTKVREFAEQWLQFANINFNFVASSEPAEIRVAFDPGGSWSALGRDALGTLFDFPTMNFGWFEDSTPNTEFSRIVLHEFGHALGLIHEHQSPSAGIPWDREKAYEYFRTTQGWSKEVVDENIFKRYSVSTTNYSTFDPSSIMVYGIPASITLDGSSVSRGVSLSATDKEYIRRWYPRPPTPANAVGTLRTGDDCDEVDFRVIYGEIPVGETGFALNLAGDVTWWKAVEIPVGSSNYKMFQPGDGGRIPTNEIDKSRPIRFWKAKFLGIHTLLSFNWDVLTAVPDGAQILFQWKRDHC